MISQGRGHVKWCLKYTRRNWLNRPQIFRNYKVCLDALRGLGDGDPSSRPFKFWEQFDRDPTWNFHVSEYLINELKSLLRAALKSKAALEAVGKSWTDYLQEVREESEKMERTRLACQKFRQFSRVEEYELALSKLDIQNSVIFRNALDGQIGVLVYSKVDAEKLQSVYPDIMICTYMCSIETC